MTEEQKAREARADAFADKLYNGKKGVGSECAEYCRDAYLKGAEEERAAIWDTNFAAIVRERDALAEKVRLKRIVIARQRVTIRALIEALREAGEVEL